MKLKKMITIAMLVALCTIGAFIKIPSPVATVAFDSLPGFVAAGLYTPVIGGCVGAAGHLISALISGFPLGVVSHLIVAAMMFLTMFVFSMLYRKNKILAAIAAVVINGPVALIPFGFMFGWPFFVSMVLSLSIAAAVNVIIAMLILPVLKKVLKLEHSDNVIAE